MKTKTNLIQTGLLTLGLLLLPLAGRAQTLGATNLLEGPTAGSDSVVLKMTGTWTATTNATWLHLSAACQSGTGGTNVVFSYDANTGTTRTGTLTIAGQTLGITQAGANYTAANPLTALVSSNSITPLYFPGGVTVDGAGNVYIADSDDNAIKKWTMATGTMSTLVSSGLSSPGSVAVDGQGNVFIADTGNSAIREWLAASGTVSNLPISGLSHPAGVALDAAGNVYIADTWNNAVKEWAPAGGIPINPTNLVSSGIGDPDGVAVDAAGNVYFTDWGNYAVKKWTAASHNVTTITTVADRPSGLAVDGAGNVYSGDHAKGVVLKWTAASNSVATLITSGLSGAQFGQVAVDGAGDVFAADYMDNVIDELPRAFVNPTGAVEGGAAGLDSLPAVLPATANLAGVFAPTSDSTNWLTITSTNNGVVSFAFTAASTNRTGHITLLGLSVPISQLGIVTSLGTTNLVEGPAAGADGVALTIAGAWTATSNVSWLHLSAGSQSGSGSATIAFTFDPNASTTRTGTLTVAGLTLTVTQAGSTYVAAPAVTNTYVDPTAKAEAGAAGSDALPPVVPATANLTGIYAPSSDSPWLTITGTNNGVVSFSFTAANTNRTGHISLLGANIAISQQINFSLGVTNLVEGPAAGADSVTLAVDSTAGVWTATANATWLQVNAGSQGGTGSATVTFTFTANTGGTRTGTLTIGGQTLAVTQAGATYGPAQLPARVANFRPLAVAVDGAGNVYFADRGNDAIGMWNVTSQTISTLVSQAQGLKSPGGVAVDGAGNVYFADVGNNAIKKRSTSGGVRTLYALGLSGPQGVAVDGAGNVYFADTGNNAIKEWLLGGSVNTLVSSGLALPFGVAVDGAGNVYIADFGNNAIKEWLPGGGINTLDASGLNGPQGVAVPGNVIIADTGNNAIKEWFPGGNVTTLVSSGLNQPSGVALDNAGIYIADSGDNMIMMWNGATLTPLVVAATNQVAQAYVNTAGLIEGAAAGSDTLPPVLPTNANLAGVFSPTTNQSWLAITGVTNGVVSFSFTANTSGSSRTGNITVLGVDVPITQQVIVTSLGTTNLLEGPASGADSVVLTIAGTWTATNNVSWLHVSAGSQCGTNSVSVAFTFDQNTGTTRTGTLTVAGLTLTVAQAGSRYVPANLTTLVASIFDEPSGVAVDGAGNVYIADPSNSAIEKWTAASGALTTLVASNLDYPSGVAVDGAGNVFIADNGDNAIKEWSPASGSLTTLVAPGVDGAPLSFFPFGVAVDGAGNVYIADRYNNAIEKWTAASGSVTTLVASIFDEPSGVAVDGAGNVYIADPSNSAIEKWTAASGALTTLVASNLDYPSGVAVDGAGNVYIADRYNNAIEKWTAASGSVTTLVASNLHYPSGVAVDGAGNVFIADNGDNAIKELPRAFVDPTAKTEPALAGNDSLPTVLPASENLAGVFAPASDSSWLTLTGVTNGVVSFAFTATTTNRTGNITLLGVNVPISQQGIVTSLGATNLVEGPAAGANSIAMTIAGAWSATNNVPWLHVSAGSQSGSGSANVVFTFDANTAATRTGTLTIAGLTLTVTQAGAAYVASSPLTTLVSDLNTPFGVAVDGAGNVYVAGYLDNAIQKWTAASGALTTLVASNLNYPSGVAVDGAGNVFIADNGDNAIKEWSPANGSLTTLVSGLNNPFGVAVDGAGNVYVAGYLDHTIQKWTAASGNVTTLVASNLALPSGVAVDGAGNVYIADNGANAIKEWSPANGSLTTLVSGLNNPFGVAVDGAGNVYIADNGDNAIKEWSPVSSSVSTVDEYPDVKSPFGVAVDGAGNVYIPDLGNHAIEELLRAFVDPAAKTEPALAGNDSLPTVLPASENLAGVFAPASDSSWLTLTGATNGVVSFAFTANTSGSSRTGHITVLGMTIPVTQGAPPTPPQLTGLAFGASGGFHFGFTNNQGASFSVWSSTNLLLPFTNWTLLGAPTGNGSGQYQFSDPSATNGGQRFYRVSSP